MKTCASDIKLLLGIFSAHILLYITYQNTNVFWYLYTATILFCLSFAVTIDKTKERQPFLKNMFIGLTSGIILYGIFVLGDSLFKWLDIKVLSKDVSQLYKHFSPSLLWHYLVLFIIIIPGEEIFWRGFIQKTIMHRFQMRTTIIISALLYTLPMLYSQNLALILSGLVAGIMWSALYQWKKSLSLVIMSHMIFDLLLIVLFPLR